METVMPAVAPRPKIFTIAMLAFAVVSLGVGMVMTRMEQDNRSQASSTSTSSTLTQSDFDFSLQEVDAGTTTDVWLTLGLPRTDVTFDGIQIEMQLSSPTPATPSARPIPGMNLVHSSIEPDSSRGYIVRMAWLSTNPLEGATIPRGLHVLGGVKFTKPVYPTLVTVSASNTKVAVHDGQVFTPGSQASLNVPQNLDTRPKPTPVPTPLPQNRVTSLEVVDQLGNTLQVIGANDKIDVATLPAKFTIKANTTGTIGSLGFMINNQLIRTDNKPLYYLTQLNPWGKLIPWRPTQGKHVFVITAYSGKNRTGQVLSTHFQEIEVINSRLR